jgi:predicted MFS family arabinose efflux permease
MFVMGLGGLLTVMAYNFWALIIGQLVMGIGASFYHPIAYGLTRHLYKESERGMAFGVVTSAGDIGVLIVFILSGLLSVFYNWRVPVGLFSILAILSSLISLKLLRVEGWSDAEEAEGVESNFFPKRIILILLVYVLVISINRISYSYIPLILFNWLPNQAVVNLYISILILAGIVGELLSGFIIDRYNLVYYIFFISIVMAMSPILFLYLENSVFSIIPLGLLGYVIYANMPIIYGYILGKDIVREYGTIYGLTVSLGMIGGFTSSVSAGFLADIYGIDLVLILMSIISVVVLIIYVVYIKKIDSSFQSSH